MSKGGGKGRVSNELVAASCAAVLAVYAAGYWRTREAADRLEAQAQVRRPSRVPVPVPAPVAEATPAPALAVPAATVEVSPPEKPAEVPAPQEMPVAKASAKVAAVPAASEEPAPEVARAPAATKNAPPPAIPSVPLPEELPAAAPEPAPAVTAAAPVQSDDAWIDALPKPADQWKDGIYSGWGYSNHGDIEAEVVIKYGRIVSSRISSCATRYPCDVIETILKQPVWRQSPDVDNVSRATESADAYYYAVTEALKLALVDAAPADAAAAAPAAAAPSP